jgi:hypothetical protein
MTLKYIKFIKKNIVISTNYFNFFNLTINYIQSKDSTYEKAYYDTYYPQTKKTVH